MSNQTRVLVTGAGGFIGHYLTRYLTERGYWVRGVDIKEPEFEPTTANEFKLLDLRNADSCLEATAGVEEVYVLFRVSAEMRSSASGRTAVRRPPIRCVHP